MKIILLFLDIKPNSPVLTKHTRKSNIPLPNASSIKDLSVWCFVRIILINTFKCIYACMSKCQI